MGRRFGEFLEREPYVGDMLIAYHSVETGNLNLKYRTWRKVLWNKSVQNAC